MHEGHEPDVLADLFHTDPLSRKHLTDVDLTAQVADAPAGSDHRGPVVAGVFELLQLAVGPVGRLIAARRGLLRLIDLGYPELPLVPPWNEDGPMLPVEYLRHSVKSETVTLVTLGLSVGQAATERGNSCHVSRLLASRFLQCPKTILGDLFGIPTALAMHRPNSGS